MDDVVIVGAGPSGSVAAAVLARAGARVRLIDRATFPRDKLCGDTLNPGTLALLRRLGLNGSVDAHGVPLDGMIVTGENGASVQTSYPRRLQGRAITRRELDWSLVGEAVRAGASFEDNLAVREVICHDSRGSTRVAGVRVGSGPRCCEFSARVTIAADGRRSMVGFRLGLLGHPPSPRRWAIGAYFEDVAGTSSFGEMHIRRGRYIGVAPVGGNLTNICLVRSVTGADRSLGQPAAALRHEISSDPLLRDRFLRARLVGQPAVLGPLAVDRRPHREVPDGLLLAGDAAGFIDPMTGDGLRFAVRGGELAALAALDVLEHGWHRVQTRLAAARRRDFAAKWRFNRFLRALVGSPAALGLATRCAPLAPDLIRAAIARAGDCNCA
jgi:flavin-dependent dehydrogenase